MVVSASCMVLTACREANEHVSVSARRGPLASPTESASGCFSCKKDGGERKHRVLLGGRGLIWLQSNGGRSWMGEE